LISWIGKWRSMRQLRKLLLMKLVLA